MPSINGASLSYEKSSSYPQRVRQTNNATYGGALPYNFINPIGVNGAYFYAKLSYTF